MANKATIQSLIARKERLVSNASKDMTVCIQGEEMTFTVQRLPVSRILEIIDSAGETDSTIQAVEYFVQIIYESVPLFQNKELQAAYDCAEPYDIVKFIFAEDIGALKSFAQQILGQYGLIDDLKN